MKNLFIGVDFSKLTIDVSFFEPEKFDAFSHCQFFNNKDGFKAMLGWLKKQSAIPPSQWMFCGEHTGLYSLNLSEYLSAKGLFIWIDTPLQIKHSMGIQRSKNDKVDSEQLALYGYRFRDKAKAYVSKRKECKALQLLSAYRERLIKARGALSQAATEMRAVIKRDPAAYYVYEKTGQQVNRLKKDIKDVEMKMMEYIEKSPALYKNYMLLVSITGIAFVNASSMLIHTDNFTRFATARQYTCYVGTAPFGKDSGTSTKIHPRVSNVANKTVKALLTQAAKCAVIHDPELREYYHRKRAEGKNDRLVTNNVRYKLISRCFSVINRQEPYQKDYLK